MLTNRFRAELLNYSIIVAALFHAMVSTASPNVGEVNSSENTKPVEEYPIATPDSTDSPPHPLGVPWVQERAGPSDGATDSSFIEFDLKGETFTDQASRTHFFPNVRELHQEREEKLGKLSEVGRFAAEFDLSEIDHVQRFQGADISDVVNVINDPFFAAEGGGAAVVLALLGNEAHAQILIDYIEREEPPETVSTQVFMAKGQALEALGLLASKTNSSHARAYLAKQVGPEIWENRSDINLSRNEHSKRMLREIGLRGAVNGLALSGASDVEKGLDELPKKIKANAKEFADFLERLDEGVISQQFLRSAKETADRSRSRGAAMVYIEKEKGALKARAEADRMNIEKVRAWKAKRLDARKDEAPIVPVP